MWYIVCNVGVSAAQVPWLHAKVGSRPALRPLQHQWRGWTLSI